jgi:hypothetical protein
MHRAGETHDDETLTHTYTVTVTPLYALEPLLKFELKYR